MSYEAYEAYAYEAQKLKWNSYLLDHTHTHTRRYVFPLSSGYIFFLSGKHVGHWELFKI